MRTTDEAAFLSLVFSTLVLDHRPDLDGDARADLLHRRAAVARFGLNLALDGLSCC
jgi:hypothetical protein